MGGSLFLGEDREGGKGAREGNREDRYGGCRSTLADEEKKEEEGLISEAEKQKRSMSKREISRDLRLRSIPMGTFSITKATRGGTGLTDPIKQMATRREEGAPG